MKKLALVLSLALLVAALPLQALGAAELTVLAAASLTDALTEIGEGYEAAFPGVKIVFSFAGSGTLQTQIEQGAPADLFVSAAQRQMNALSDQDLIVPESRLDLLENQVVLILPLGQEAPATFEAIADAPVIAIGEPGSVPVGQYSMEIFDFLNLTEALTAEVGKLIYARDVREVLTYVATGNVDAGIVYATDAMTEENIAVVAAAPEGSHQRVIYPAAVLAGSPQAEAAQAFLDYLSTKEAGEIFQRYGFTALTAETPAKEEAAAN